MILFAHPRFQGEEVDHSRNILTSQIGIFSLLTYQELQLGKGISKGCRIGAKSLGRVGCNSPIGDLTSRIMRAH